MKFVRNLAAIGGGASIMLASAAVAFASHGGPHTVMRYFAPTEKMVGQEYVETIEITNTSSHALAVGNLQVELPAQVQLVSSSPSGTGTGAMTTIPAPSIPVNGRFFANVVVKAVLPGEFVISSATYFVNGERYGFMSAPENISATATGVGVGDDDAGGVGDDEGAGVTDLPRTGAAAGPTLFTLGLLLLSWGAVRSKMVS
ncbi:MAG: hypothetical protein A3C85_01750 [Candidatus Doudnabacteria bacterium RIFCSPHIGHO2_02_FULL_48_21]|uniref:DUF11 domain-containing protein n=1 Tax=Candidatus Doudnabacteria bacterium RIFCSPLOWO2_02_FULL_48_13 TaxID=1817845 RepID=A0A1F5QD20_9BACT|nr:MAG: hypothetical protein A3K05_02715 [Candidatus Doudnabacteria bacterium RIFCSPHIGHO2_01_48_18]OGE77457.1 MAG: hypothetical protein A2668_04205 [Candidatus Doudnabacteria bacterium RIFCSPHIGHO2_01_FULL_48_180]OGE91564.1 MAG: hypothetical protein A3F44_04035 [Candidatus Doudnabacteria bacterium RIFCSPHIGHO2_12_FULL_47_25]OGE93154.1 MAG: hypothetical protein A3C85_01750 [Candidatus Doudnabacteria bacterium RIFCSPHIGHO2_02_FULL_48_21]OGE97248.1 MAG: hypothetical protein A3A83_01390 [Candidatu